MRGAGGWLAGAGGVALALATMGCDRERDVAVSGPAQQQGIVLEDLKVEQTVEDFQDRCRLTGKIRNQTGAGQRVTLVFEAFDGDGRTVASAVTTIDFVAAGQPGGFSTRLRNLSDDGFLNDCDRVARAELHEVIL